MSPLALLKFWKVGVMAALGLLLVVQTARLDNAKRDQVNPATKVKWQTEAKAFKRAIDDPNTGWRAFVYRKAYDLKTCQINRETLQAGIRLQNAEVDRWKAEAARRGRDAQRTVNATAAALRAANAAASTPFARAPASGDRCAALEALINGDAP